MYSLTSVTESKKLKDFSCFTAKRSEDTYFRILNLYQIFVGIAYFFCYKDTGLRQDFNVSCSQYNYGIVIAGWPQDKHQQRQPVDT